MQRKIHNNGFAGILFLIFATLAGILLYIAFTKGKTNRNPIPLNAELESIEIQTNTNPTTVQAGPNNAAEITIKPTGNNNIQPTSVPLQYTISPTKSLNSSYPTSQPALTATPQPTQKGKGNGGGGSGTGISTGG